jgi:hypothetical protein
MSFVVEVITIGGGLSDFFGAPFSGRAFSAPVVSVSKLLVLRGAQNLRVIAALVGSLPAADFGTDIVEFLAVCEVSLEICLLRRLIPGSNHGPLIPMRFWSLLHSVLRVHSPSGWHSVHSMLVCIFVESTKKRFPFNFASLFCSLPHCSQ